MVSFVEILLLNREVSITTTINKNAMTSTVSKMFKILILLVEALISIFSLYLITKV